VEGGAAGHEGRWQGEAWVRKPGGGRGRLFFFEKKHQKTSGHWRMGPGERTRQRIKVFCFFSSEKKILPYFI
jgi:hypothetical protein